MDILEKTVKKTEATLKELTKEYDKLDKMKEYNQEYRRWLEGNIYAYQNVLEYIYTEKVEKSWELTSQRR